MVKIRLRRMGNKHRPFYRVVVAKSTSGRNGAFIEVLGTYNSVSQPKEISINGDRALHWLRQGAQPTETVAILLKRQGVLDQYLEERPNAKRDYKFLDKRTAAMSRQSVVQAVAAPAKEKAPEPEPVVAEAPADAVEEPVAEAAAEPVEAVEAESPEPVPAAEAEAETTTEPEEVPAE